MHIQKKSREDAVRVELFRMSGFFLLGATLAAATLPTSLSAFNPFLPHTYTRAKILNISIFTFLFVLTQSVP